MEALPQLVVNGLIAGGAYALGAIGYSMVYSILKFVNFANGSMAMIGGYLAFVAMTRLGASLPVALIFGMLATAALGMAIDRVAYRPLRKSPKIICLITAMATSFILEAMVLLVMGAEYRSFPLAVTKGLRLGSVYITPLQIGMLVVALLFLAGLYVLLNKTRIGKQIRAVADNSELAAINGISTERAISLVFGIGSALAAAAGALVGLDTVLSPSMGFGITMKGWAACVFGGMGRIEGAILGGFIIGLTENFGVWFITGGDARWKLTIAYIVMMLILLLKPSGILGSKEDVAVLG